MFGICWLRCGCQLSVWRGPQGKYPKSKFWCTVNASEKNFFFSSSNLSFLSVLVIYLSFFFSAFFFLPVKSYVVTHDNDDDDDDDDGDDDADDTGGDADYDGSKWNFNICSIGWYQSINETENEQKQ